MSCAPWRQAISTQLPFVLWLDLRHISPELSIRTTGALLSPAASGSAAGTAVPACDTRLDGNLAPALMITLPPRSKAHSVPVISETTVVERGHLAVTVGGVEVPGLGQVTARIQPQPGDGLPAGRVFHRPQKLPSDPSLAGGQSSHRKSF